MQRAPRVAGPQARPGRPAAPEVYRAMPLRDQVEILVDRWGIPHIYAGCPEDLFFAQGFNAARDRLWQIDLWRRCGLGLLSEALGPAYLARDRAARLFLYRGPMEQEWSAYGCDMRSVAGPFVAGINEYIRLTERRPELLPAEFAALGYRPAAWQPDDVLRIRSHGRFRNVSSEVTRAAVLRDFGPGAEALRVLLEPAADLDPPPGLDLSLITPEILRDYELATAAADISSPGRSSPGPSSPGPSSAGPSSAGPSSPGRSSAGPSSPGPSSPGPSSAGPSSPGRSSAGRSSAGRSSAGRSFPGPAFPGPAFPGPAFPGPAFPGPAFPGPAFPGPAFPGPSSPGPAQALDGSNNWAVSGRRTATGRPILANDPHRALTVPSLRYLAHLVCPGLNVIGGGEPTLPGVSIGHNERVAFGLTILPVDQEDLYVYETDPADPSRYRYRDGWEQMETVTETVRVRGGEAADVTLKFTRHGPVVHEVPERQAAFAVRAAWLQPGMAPYAASIGLMAADDWAGFQAAARSWGAPGENLVYADVDDNIAWQPAALIPVRRNWTGLLPVPGDGRYEWDGYLTAADLPVELNPSRGWLATANQRNVEPGQVGGVDVSFEWEPPFRFQRIGEVLGADRQLTVAGAAALQSDYLSPVARRLRAPLGRLRCDDPLAASGAALLAGWDGRLEPGSAAAALFEVWFWSHLRPRLLAAALSGQVPAGQREPAAQLLADQADLRSDARIELALIEAAGSTPQAAGQLESMLEASLISAIRQLTELLGADIARWQWGALHRARLEHPLAGEAVDDKLGELGSQPRGGNGDTVGSTPYSLADFAQAGGATMRMVLDVGDWDNSLAMNSPGQSGDPGSHHYADLYAAWARDESIPLLYSRQRVEAAAEHKIMLLPGAG
jgi:penicillin G amidase